jgi:tetratricopeptide (TPR) repeat protein
MSLLALSLALISFPAAANDPVSPESGAPHGGWDQGGVLKKEAIDRALHRFDDLGAEIARKYPGNQEYVDIVKKAKTEFSGRAGAFLPDKPYRSLEFKVMGDVVEITITQLKKQVALQEVAATTNMSGDVLAARSQVIKQEGSHAMIQSLKASGFAPMAPQPIEAGTQIGANPIPAKGTGGSSDAAAETGVQADPATGGMSGIGSAMTKGVMNAARGAWNGGWFEGDDASRLAWEKRVGDNSPIVILGVKSTNCAMDSTRCSIDPPLPVPAPPIPAPSEPGSPRPPANTAPNGSGSGSGWGGPTNESAVNDIVKTIVTTGGTNAMASQSVLALQRGEYARAAALAQNTLRFDPGNKNATEVLYSVKGRGDALDAGTNGLRAASADAFGPSSFVGGGAASPSPDIAAAALSGAAKIVSDQARAGAVNALKLNDAQGALGILSKALAQNPADSGLLNARAMIYGRLGRWDDALKDAVSGLALLPGNMALLKTKAIAENRSRRWRDALATADMMIAADPRNPWGYAARAHARGGLGDKAAMMADIEQAARLDPSFQRAAAAAALLQLPSDSDVLFLFPGEAGKGGAPAPAPSGRGKSFSVVVGAGIVGGLLLALGLLSTVLSPLKDTVVSVFTRTKRTGPETNRAVATAQPASAAGNVGGLIRGQYEISRQIGAGGMGMVYEGTDRSLGRRVAIKKMRDELRLNARERDRFIIEAKTVASLHHPNIVDIYAIAEEGEDVYLVFEYVDGKTVHDLVQLKGRLDPAESVRVTQAMGEALTYAHAHGVIHRDMKPSNVMVTAAGQIKVMDFGIARMAKDALTRYSMTNTVVGTPPYMAPEQEQGVVRKESDVYSLAICAYEMLTGKLPFIGIGAGMLMNKINMSYIPPSRNIAGLPEPLDEVFLKAFQADPDQRYRTPQEFVAALAAASDGARSKTA